MTAVEWLVVRSETKPQLPVGLALIRNPIRTNSGAASDHGEGSSESCSDWLAFGKRAKPTSGSGAWRKEILGNPTPKNSRFPAEQRQRYLSCLPGSSTMTGL